VALNALPSRRRIHAGIFGNTSQPNDRTNRIPERRNSPSRSKIPEAVNPKAVTKDQMNEITVGLVYVVY
jgi:hypothetical protein